MEKSQIFVNWTVACFLSGVCFGGDACILAMVLDKTIAKEQSRGRSSIPIQDWTSCLLRPLQLLQGTRNLKEGFLPSAFME